MNAWHIVEVIIIIAVIIYQIFHTSQVYFNIKYLQKIFEFKLYLKNGFVEKSKIGKIDFESNDIIYEDNDEFINESFSDISGNDIIKMSLVDTKGKNEIISKIKVAINTYLINNYGAAVNFSIIKDIVDREIEVKDEEITQSVTLPLYLGLAATMIGIIFGLFSMPELDGVGFSKGVNALIDGVKIAMIGSLSGLALTTYLSSFSYKNAKKIVQKDKNEQITYLQAKLLPELIKAEDTGVSGLKASLDRFARVATSISDNVLIASNQTGENLLLQKEVIEKIENMKMLKVSKWNLELFEKMDNNMQAFNNFSAYLSNMEKITTNLSDFANKTSDVNSIINNINNTLSESRNLTRYLTSHFDKIDNLGEVALKSVGIVESHFEEAIESLKERTDEMISQLYKSSGNHQVSLESIYKEIENNLSTITSQYVDAFQIAFTDSIPSFTQLNNLELIKEINTTLNNMKQNQALINKLSSIEESLKKRSSRNNSSLNSSTSQNDEPKQRTEFVGLGKVLKNLF